MRRIDIAVTADRMVRTPLGFCKRIFTHAQLTAAGGLYARMWADYNQAVQWKITGEKEAE